MAKTFDFDAAIADATGAPFTFTWAGKGYELPNLNSLPADDVLTAFTGSQADQIALIKRSIGDAADGIFAAPMGAVNQLIEAWMEHSGMTPGEAEASSH